MDDIQLAFPDEFPQEATKLPDVSVLAEQGPPAPVAGPEAPKQPLSAPPLGAPGIINQPIKPLADRSVTAYAMKSHLAAMDQTAVEPAAPVPEDVPVPAPAPQEAAPPVAQRTLAGYVQREEAKRSDPANYVELTNKGATRNLPLDPQLMTSIASAVEAVYGPGYKAQVYSGGQPETGPNRVGTTRHDNGKAADVYIVGPDGQRLKGDRLAPLFRHWASNNLGGVGLEMRDGGIHLDIHKDRAKFWTYSALSPEQAKVAKELGLGEFQTAKVGDLSSRIEPSLNQAIIVAAAKEGIPADYLRVTALIESSGGFDKRSNGNARGPFQFMPGTWEQFGMGGDPSDPTAAAHAAARLAKANMEGLRKALGRAPTPQEMYLAHQQGVGGASGLLTNPSKRAIDVVGEKAVVGNGGSANMTSAEFVKFLKEKYDARAEMRDSFKPVTRYDISRPPALNVAPGWTAASLEAQRVGYKQEAASFASLWKESFEQTTAYGRLANMAPHFQATPGWSASKEDLATIPKQYLSQFEGAASQAEFDFLRSRMMQRDALNQRLNEAGWKGISASVLAGLADPVPWVVGAGFGALANGAVQASRLGGVGGRVASGVAGGVANVATDVVTAELSGNPYDLNEAFFSFALGAGIGATIGHIGTNPALREEAAHLDAASMRMRQEALKGSTALSGSPQGGGAMLSGTPYPAMSLDEGFAAINPGDVQMGAMAAARRVNPLMGEGSRVATSESDAVRAAGSILGSDVVGKTRGADGFVSVNPQAADQEQRRVFAVRQSGWALTLEPNYQEWAKAQGYNWPQRAFKKGWEDFNEQVSLYVWERNSAVADQFPDPVKRAGEAFRKGMREHLLDQQNPGREAGLTMRPVAGAENIVEDPHYVPRMWDAGKIDSAVTQHSYVQVSRMVTAAIRKAQPELDEDLAGIFSDAILKNKLSKMYGMDDRLGRILSQPDRELIKDFIKDAPGVQATDEQIERMISQLSKRTQEGAKDARMMRRIDLDETFYVDLPTGRLGIRDLIETNADSLFTRYNRQASGSIALARTRYQHPTTGEILIDGITGDADFEAMIRNIQKWEMENRSRMSEKRTADDLARDVEALRHMYDRIKGRPDPSQLGDPAKILRTIRNYNTARLMGMVGFAQLMDFGRVAGSAGIKVLMKQMPAFRRLRVMDGKAILAHGIDREIEAMFGVSSDHLMAPTRRMVDDGLAGKSPNGKLSKLDKAEAYTGQAADMVMEASGFHYVNQVLKNWNYRLLLQKFSDMADEAVTPAAKAGSNEATSSVASLKKEYRNMLRHAGIPDEMADRILGQFRRYRSTKEGTITGAKLTQLNLHEWDDLEAAAVLKRGLFKLASNIVQENDVGGLHKYMSHPLAQTMTQFRLFPLYAYENMLLHGAHNRDGRQLSMMTAALMSGALVYMVQTQLQAIGRPDADKFIEDRMGDPGKIALAALGRAGWTSVLPMLADTGALAIGADPIFGNARASGQPSDGIFGNPTIGLFNDTLNASKALAEVVQGGTYTQQDARTAARIIAGQNLMGITQMYSLLISGLPER